MLRFRSKLDWQQSAAHLMLLSYFTSPREDYQNGRLGGHTWQEWKMALKESPTNAIERFLDSGALELAGLAQRLAYRYGVSDLKAMLRERGLPVSGRKADLIARLVEKDRAGMQHVVSDLTLLQCSKHGREIVEAFLTLKKEKRARVEQRMLDALRKRDLREAANLRVSFEAEQVFPSGLGISWEDYPFREQDVELLRCIFRQKPKIMAQLSDEQLEPLRLAAGMFVLGWNLGQVRDWLPSDLDTGLGVSNEVAARMLHSHAQFLIEMKELRGHAKSGLLQVYIHVLTCNDDHVCAACRKLAARRYTLGEVPELPYRECTSEDGCRCSIAVQPVVS